MIDVMAKKQVLKDYQSKYDCVLDLGNGGNALVYSCTDKRTGKEVALKELKNNNRSDEKRARFIDEIEIMVEHGYKTLGVLPIFDYSKEHFWYTMPIATPIIFYIKSQETCIVSIIDGIIDLVETLSVLHAQGVSHRDIKPSNIYYYNNRYYLGDFGLVDFPDNPNDFTRSDKGLGAIFTIAPEMKRNPKEADGKKADVFSLAKTLWMLLTLDDKGFDGTYDFSDKTHGLHFYQQYKDTHLVELEELLYQATQNNPDHRLTMDEFRRQLENWIHIQADIHLSQLSDWNFIKKHLFRDSPESTRWTDLDAIINVLNTVGNVPAMNHMLFSNQGGLDFDKAERANEDGCIYIYDGFCNIVKPKCLYFESFGDPEWNYFLLELDELKPILDDTGSSCEQLVEDYPAHYVSAKYSQYGVYDYDKGDKLPEGAQLVYRYLNGKFLIIFKLGPYNHITATYDGRHGNCSNTEFRRYIEYILQTIQEGEKQGYSQEEVLHSPLFDHNPFCIAKGSIDVVQDREKKPSPVKFIRESYREWCFMDIIEPYAKSKSGNIEFYFEFDMNNKSVFRLLENDRYYILKDGYIKKYNDEIAEGIFRVGKREQAIDIHHQLSEKLKILCEGYDTEYLPMSFNFSIKLRKTGGPTHLFTKEDIKKLMINADDRNNNKLVIDENGYAKLIQDHFEGNLYPTSQETWFAGNKYVGKYSLLASLDDSYLMALEGWLCYLKSGKRKYIDVPNYKIGIDSLLEEIEAFYGS